jgi:hypothetical protein
VKRPIIFLDCDGVLNNYSTHTRSRLGDPRAPFLSEDRLVNRLQDFVFETNAIVCISSTWRKRCRSTPKSAWRETQRRDMMRLIGPWLDDFIPRTGAWRTPSMLSGFRGSEIAEWFRMYPKYAGSHHVIFDDDRDFYEDQPFVHVNPEFGLRDCDIIDARAMLREQGLPYPDTTEHPNGAPMFAASGMMLDDQGNRSIFDDVDA